MQNQSPPSFAIFDDYRPTVAILVVVRWLLLLTWFVLNNYRVEADTGHLILNLMGVALAVLNAYMSWRVITRRPITWRHALALSLADLAMITVGLFLKFGIRNDFYVFYYPALLGFSLMFPRRAAFAVVAVVATLYIVVAFTVEPTFSMALEDEKKLAVRIINMAGIVAAGGMITRWERARRREAVAAERQRAEENLQLQAENSALKVEIEQLRAIQSMATRSAHYSLLRQQYSFETLLAGVIWKSPSFHSDHFGINAGIRVGLRKDSAVLSPEGIVGRVVTVEPFGAEIEPITARGSAIGGVLSRSRLQGVLQGDGSELLEWRLIPNHEKVEIGEVVYTSGADRIYPKGLPIGLIVKSERGEMVYRDIRVRPFVDYSRLEEVMVMTTP